MTVKASKIVDLLKKVHLNGLINQVKIDAYDDGVWVIECIDDGSSVLLSCQTEIIKGIDAELGIGDIKTLMKWLKVVKDGNVDIQKKDNRLIFISEEKGTLKYLLKDVEYISTMPEIEDDKSPLDLLLEKVEYDIQIPQDLKSNLSDIMSVTKPVSINLICNEGKVSIQGGSSADHQFELSIGSISDEKSFVVSVDGKGFLQVLSVIEGEAELRFCDHAPIVVYMNEANIWSVNNILEEE